MVGLYLLTTMAHGEFSATSRPHHFFNAELLPKGDSMTSIIGNTKYGLFETTEIGTQGIYLALGTPNLYLKHSMFEFENVKTSFVMHTFFATPEGIVGAAEVITSFYLDDHQTVSAGLLDFAIFAGDSRLINAAK